MIFLTLFHSSALFLPGCVHYAVAAVQVNMSES